LITTLTKADSCKEGKLKETEKEKQVTTLNNDLN